MCTNPITINHRYGNKVVSRVVPCGKCSECRSIQQSQFAALTLMELADADSFVFATLTYRDKDMMWSLVNGDDYDLQRGLKYSLSSEGKLTFTKLDDLVYYPTLHREDLKDHMKRFRKSIGIERSKMFRYACFGEYGSRRNRPHYHCCLVNLSPQECSIFSDLWQKYYGSACLINIPRFNLDGSNAYLKVAKYIAKYVSKGDALPDFCRFSSVEKPRKMCSRSYGLRNLDISRLRNFI